MKLIKKSEKNMFACKSNIYQKNVHKLKRQFKRKTGLFIENNC